MLLLKKLSSDVGMQVFLKMELNNIGGSVKDRTAKEIIFQAIRRGELGEGDELVEGTSGSTGIALSLIANVLKITPKIILPNNLAQEKYKLLELFNADLVKVPPRSFIDEENYVKTAENFKGKKGRKSFYCDQFDNMDNFWVHFNETGPEIWEQLDQKVDFFVCSSGTGGTISGVSVFMKSRNPNFKTILADPEGSSLFSFVRSGVLYTSQNTEFKQKKTPDYTVIEGVGVNRLTKNFLRGNIDLSFRVGDEESMHMSHYLIQNEGVFLGGSSCLNLVAVAKLANHLRQQGVSKEELAKMRVVSIANDSGFRYLSKFYNPDYVKKYGIDFRKKDTYDCLDFIDFNY